jgi:hypothetical protein
MDNNPLILESVKSACAYKWPEINISQGSLQTNAIRYDNLGLGEFEIRLCDSRIF